MIFQFADVVSAPLLEAAREECRRPEIWRDGRDTAEGRAKSAKRNEQALASGPAKGLLDTLAHAVLADRRVASAAQPSALARIMLNRYRDGMEYGPHVDAPYVDDVRTDLSFTLFLSDPADYEGGELLIDGAGEEDSVKLPAGAIALYPSTSLHRVARVSRGERLAAVGWIKSRVRAEEDRIALFELDRIGADLAALSAPGDIRERLANIRNNLLRRWGD
jgi:PKHD-type hydroxylase